MIEGSQYISTVKTYFSFLEEEFGMKVIEEKNEEMLFMMFSMAIKTKLLQFLMRT